LGMKSLCMGDAMSQISRHSMHDRSYRWSGCFGGGVYGSR
jgi:hypothetical protein